MERQHLNGVDVDLQHVAKSMPHLKLTRDNLEDYRANVLSHAKTTIDPRLDVTIEDVDVPYEDELIHVILFRPNKVLNNMPGYLYMHGGGMVSGGAHLDNSDNARIAHELGCVVVSVDYQLAPETIFPGQLETCYAVLKWMHDEADTLLINRSKLAVGGNSAGGMLAASLAQLALDRGEVDIIFQNLHIPMLDDQTVLEAPSNPYAGHVGWNRDMNRFAWEMYLGHPVDGRTPEPYAVPARRQNFEGLPATFITIGSLDLFVDEVMEYAQNLLHAGVSTELHIYPGRYHLGELVPGARVRDQILNDRLNAMRRAFED
ncbi:alpha/beta hydrolase [Staphylococcus pseudintermedius]|uniref:alpha/beta hydrolase n=1 Tax=Staphylococcus pseudintermedius TaxID=283734 RepID=UPI00286DA6DB|nr:alpha/beta hydrolase [Staphylococcus pseudintermedius]WMZ79674.1 alpha/beta hydrolase [Staphylococcus pseudintermedius]